jgi:hypothetical protein
MEGMAGCKMECQESKLGVATFSGLIHEKDSVVGVLGVVDGNI